MAYGIGIKADRSEHLADLDFVLAEAEVDRGWGQYIVEHDDRNLILGIGIVEPRNIEDITVDTLDGTQTRMARSR